MSKSDYRQGTAVAMYNDAPPVTRWEMAQKQLPGASEEDDDYVDGDFDDD